MKPHFAENGANATVSRWTGNLPLAGWALLGLPVIYLAHSVTVTVIPIVVHAVVPEVVRTILQLM